MRTDTEPPGAEPRSAASAGIDSSKRPLWGWLRLLRVRVAILGVATVLLAVELTGMLLTRHAAQHTVHDQLRTELIEASRSARMLDDRVRVQVDAMTIGLQSLDVASLSDVDKLESFLRARPLLRSQFDSEFFTDANGRLLLVHDDVGFRRSGADLSDREYIQRALAGASALVSKPLTGRLSNEPIVVIAHALSDEHGVRGVAGGVMRLRSHPLLAGIRPDGTAAGVVLMITDHAGTILGHSDAALIGRHVSEDRRLQALWKRATAAGILDASAPDPASIPRNEDAGAASPLAREVPDPHSITAVAPMSTAGWLLWRIHDRAALLAPLASARAQAHWISAAVAALIAPLLMAALWWQLQPLQRLQKRAERMFVAGIDPETGWPNAGGEIGRLSDALRRIGIERLRLEQENERALRGLQSLMTATPTAIFLAREGAIELANPAASRLLAWPTERLIGHPILGLIADHATYPSLNTAVCAAFSRSEPYVGAAEFRRSDDSRFWGRFRGQPLDWDDPAEGTIWTLDDISNEVAENAALEWAASHDPLTNLGNRSLLQKTLLQLVGAPRPQRPAQLIILDLDRFKLINDCFGHAAGDAMLRTVARAIEGCVRAHEDLIVRTGGDEFAVVLLHCHTATARRIAQDIIQAVNAIRLPWLDTTLTVGISIGIAPLDESVTTMEAWVHAADSACYAAKSAGRGRVQVAGLPRSASSLPNPALAREAATQPSPGASPESR